MKSIDISVIIVTLNEEKYIVNCIKSIQNQFIDCTNWELIIVDSISDDNTIRYAKEYLINTSINYKIICNPKKILASGWNTGIKESFGKYVMRPDAHSALFANYIMTRVEILNKHEDLTAVGGKLVTIGRGFWGKIIQEALSSQIAVGNSSFRTYSKDCYSDTAVYAIYRKEIFNKIGYFNENLVRHQDNEMHKRIHDSGGKFYFCTKMQAKYYCRDDIYSLLKQMYSIGIHLPAAGLNSLSIRHLAPCLFTLFLSIGLLFSLCFSKMIYVYLFLISIYSFLILFEFSKRSIKKKNYAIIFNVFIVPMMHLSYGIGTLIGILNLINTNFIVKK